jgi:hypothetical protein
MTSPCAHCAVNATAGPRLAVAQHAFRRLALELDAGVRGEHAQQRLGARGLLDRGSMHQGHQAQEPAGAREQRHPHVAFDAHVREQAVTGEALLDPVGKVAIAALHDALARRTGDFVVEIRQDFAPACHARGAHEQRIGGMGRGYGCVVHAAEARELLRKRAEIVRTLGRADGLEGLPQQAIDADTGHRGRGARSPYGSFHEMQRILNRLQPGLNREG